MIFKNVSPLGGLELVVDGRLVTVDAGGELEVTGEQAARLLEQPDNWARSDMPQRKITDEEQS